jgi:uncharacterized membrane protein YeiH
VLINEIPLVFRKEIYALACVIGGIVFTLMHAAGLHRIATELTTAATVILIRILAVRYQWHLPILTGGEQKS